MKKSSIALLVLGFLLIVGGGVTALLTFSGAKDSVTKNIDEAYTVSGDTLNLVLSSPTQIYLTTSDTQKVEITGTVVSLNDSTVTTQQADNTVSVTIKKGTSQDSTKKFITDLASGEGVLNIAIPRSIKNLSIESPRLQAHNLTLASLSVTQTKLNYENESSYWYFDALKTNELTVSGNDGNFSFTEPLIETLVTKELNSSQLTLTNGKITSSTFNGNNNDFQLDNSFGPMDFQELSGGSVSLRNHNGDVAVIGDGLNLEINDRLAGNLTAKLERGNITGYLENDQLANILITANTTTGTIALFDQEDSKTFGAANSKYHWDLSTTIGDIRFQQFEVYEEDYDEEYDDDNQQPEASVSIEGSAPEEDLDNGATVASTTAESSTADSTVTSSTTD